MGEQALLQRSIRLDPVPASAGAARRMVRAVLTEAGASEASYAAELAVSEIVTNAVLHAATTFEVTIEVTASSVTVWVRDWHPQLPAERAPSETATTGRGLAIVAGIVDEQGVELRPPEGKAVWFRLARK